MKKPNLVAMAAGIGNRRGGLKQTGAMGGYGQRITDYSIHCPNDQTEPTLGENE